jgi:ribonuclease D
MQIHPLITDSASLSALCDRLSRSPFVAVDTEFMRENTFWPDLCLIQIADANEAAAIDPKASDLDLTPLLDLLVDNEDVLKVFHAGGQDIEIVYNITGKTPHPLFDTQIASMALSQGEQIGYGNLVEAWLGISLDKGARFTDWGRRPLDKRQIDYAIGDVTHLARLFPMMLEQLRKTGRGAWLDQEMERLADPANYALDPQEAWRRSAPGANMKRATRTCRAAASSRTRRWPTSRPIHRRNRPIWARCAACRQPGGPMTSADA